MANKTQRYDNHARFDPAYHFFLAPVALVFLILSIVDLVRDPGWSTAWCTLAAIAGVVAVLKIRTYALKVQDRVIRLEERLRLSQVLPEPLRARMGELSESQLIALRFASDQELPGLVEKTL